MTKTISVVGSKVCGEVTAIPSKSYAHRIAICQFLSGRTVDVGSLTSKDISATKNCLSVLQSGGNVLDCGESGSTLRFLIPLSLSLGGEYVYTGHGKLMDRPNDQLFECLKAKGIEIKKVGERIVAKGALTPGEYRIRGDVSSQYVSGLLMALSRLDGESTVVLTTPLASSPYVDITLEVLGAFGIEVKRKKDCFVIKGGTFKDSDVQPEGDWSNAAFFLVLGGLAGKVSVRGLNADSAQGDKVILDVLKSAGVDVQIEDGVVTTSKSSIQPFAMDAEDCPDLVPIVSVLAAFGEGKSVIKNVSRLRLKESDRIETTIDMLSGFGVRATSDGHDLIVYGGSARHGKTDSHNDHRIAMAATVLATAVEGRSQITDYTAIEKSYPTFYEDVTKIGGTANEVQ